MSAADRFNRSGFGRFINTGSGRVLRLAVGTGFLGAGLVGLPSPFAISFVAWRLLPLSAGALDVCWVSVALGGPLAGGRIRAID